MDILKIKGEYKLRLDHSQLTLFLAEIYCPRNNFIAQIQCTNNECKEAIEWFAVHNDVQICGWVQEFLSSYAFLAAKRSPAIAGLRDLIQADELNENELGMLMSEHREAGMLVYLSESFKRLNEYPEASQKLRDLLMGLPFDNLKNASDLFLNMALAKADASCTLAIEDRTKTVPEAADAYNIVIRRSLANGIVVELFGRDDHQIAKMPASSGKAINAINWFTQHDAFAATAAASDFLAELTYSAFNADRAGMDIIEILLSGRAQNLRQDLTALSQKYSDKKITELVRSFCAMDSIDGAAENIHDIITDGDLSDIPQINIFFYELHKAKTEGVPININNRLPKPTFVAVKPIDGQSKNFTYGLN